MQEVEMGENCQERRQEKVRYVSRDNALNVVLNVVALNVNRDVNVNSTSFASVWVIYSHEDLRLDP